MKKKIRKGKKRVNWSVGKEAKKVRKRNDRKKRDKMNGRR